MNSIIVIKDCVVQLPNLPLQSFAVDDIVQPWSPYFYALLWSDLANDSGIPAEPNGDNPELFEVVYVQHPTEDGLAIMWSQAEDRWVLYDPADYGGAVPGVSNLTDVDLTGLDTGDILVWDGVSGKWEAQPPVSGGTIPDGSITAVKLADGSVALNGTKVTGSLPINKGGTGGTTAATARTALGLGNVQNTSDADKEISTATAAALAGKASTGHTHVVADITDFPDIGGGGIAPFFSPEDYGAVGDGVADDTAEIQAALDAAFAGGGGIVYLNKGSKYGWSGTLTVMPSVTLAGTVTRQNPVPDDPSGIPGLIALNSAAQINLKGNLRNVFVDGNFVGGQTPTKAGLVRITGVDLQIQSLFVSRSKGDGIVIDGLQNSSFFGCYSTLNVGAALVLDNGPGGLSFNGGYYGTSKGGSLICRDTSGETNIYPFGPTQNTFVGTLFEAYGNIEASWPTGNLTEPFAHHVVISGRSNTFINCNFTGGASNSDSATVLINDSASIIPDVTTFVSCLWWVKGGHDAVRVVGNGIVTFVGLQEIGDNGTDHATSFCCVDGGFPNINLQGQVLIAGDVNGNKVFRAINSGSLLQTFNIKDSGQINRMRSTQSFGFRGDGDAQNRLQIERDGIMRWFNGSDGTTRATLSRATAGDGKGLVVGNRLYVLNALNTISTYYVIDSASKTVNIDASAASEHRFSFVNSGMNITTMTITNGVDGDRLRIGIFGLGVNSITWPADFVFAGTPPQPENGKIKFIDFSYAGGTVNKWIEVTIPGPAGSPGSAGPANSLAIGTVTTGAPGSAADADITGTPPSQTLDLTIPAGDIGLTGAVGPIGPPGPVGFPFRTTMSSGTLVLDPTSATEYTVTLTGNISLSVSNLRQGAAVTLDVVQDSVGGRTLTVPSDWIGQASLIVSTGANVVDTFVVRRSGAGVHISRMASETLPTSLWTPNNLSNKIAWYSADAIPLADEGDAISTWSNLAAATNLAAGGTSPIFHRLNGRGYLDFNGTTDHMDATHSPAVNQPFLIGMVVKVATAGPVLSGSVNTAHDILITGTNWEMEPASGMTRPNDSDWSTVVCEYKTGGNDTLRVNGSDKSDVNVNTLKVATYTRIGGEDGGTHNAVKYAEIIKCSGTIDSTTRGNLESYLNRIRDDLKGL